MERKVRLWISVPRLKAERSSSKVSFTAVATKVFSTKDCSFPKMSWLPLIRKPKMLAELEVFVSYFYGTAQRAPPIMQSELTRVEVNWSLIKAS